MKYNIINYLFNQTRCIYKIKQLTNVVVFSNLLCMTTQVEGYYLAFPILNN